MVLWQRLREPQPGLGRATRGVRHECKPRDGRPRPQARCQIPRPARRSAGRGPARLAGSYSAFSATTDNGTQSWTSGNMTLVNNGGTATYAGSTTAVFNDTNLKPG